MKILIPTADYPPIEGGISTATVQISRELARLGHDVTVVAPAFDAMAEFDVGEPVRVERYRGYGLGWLRYVPMSRRARPFLDAADVVVGVNIGYGALLAERHRKPYVVLAYGYEFLKFRRNPVLKRLLLGVYETAGKTIAISTYTRDALVEFGVDRGRIEVIYPGAPVRGADEPISRDEIRERFGIHGGPVVLAVGRFIARKGQETLIDAMPGLLETFPGAQLVLAGRGPRLDAARDRASRKGVAGQVVFAGRVSDAELAALYDVCDVFALPTGEEPGGHVEGFGLVFCEAQAHGKPVIAGRSGGTADAVLDEETGLIVEPEDLEGLLAALRRILGDPALAARLGEAGRRRVESELNWGRFTARLAEILETLA